MGSRFKIGDRVIFTEFACIHTNINMPVVYSDVNHTDVKYEFSDFNNKITRNMDKLVGIVVRYCGNVDNYSVMFEYNKDFFFSEVSDVFLERDINYYREKSIDLIL